MRQRYRFYACPTDGCPKLATKSNRCAVHDVEMVPVILRREDQADKAIRTKHAADQVAAAGKKVGEAGGRRPAFGLRDLFGD